MQKAIRIERRYPFGFRGDWGKLYKRFTAEAELKLSELPNDIIKHEKNYYRDIGEDVQFREAADETGSVELPNTGLAVDTAHFTVKTTDAYFNGRRGKWECVVAADDIVEVFGSKWIAANVTGRVARRAPQLLMVYYIDLTSII